MLLSVSLKTIFSSIFPKGLYTYFGLHPYDWTDRIRRVWRGNWVAPIVSTTYSERVNPTINNFLFMVSSFCGAKFYPEDRIDSPTPEKGEDSTKGG